MTERYIEVLSFNKWGWGTNYEGFALVYNVQ